jgi:putative toxin-antitoxin system antitoxin component (TIGR02293 family)
MAEDLKGYDGDVNGFKILHGVAIVSQVMSTATSRAESPALLPSSESESGQGTDIEPIIERSVEVIGNREEAMRWLGTPVRALDYATPISCLHDPAGKEQVLTVLTQLEHGVL